MLLDGVQAALLLFFQQLGLIQHARAHTLNTVGSQSNVSQSHESR